VTALATLASASPADLDATLRERRLDDASVPWWALALLDLEVGSDMHQLRTRRHQGISEWPGGEPPPAGPIVVDPDRLLLWHDLVDLARRSFRGLTPRQAIDAMGSAACRHAACTSIRALGQFIELRDDDLEPMVFRDFHVRGIRYMRTAASSVILWPFAHAKSATSSIVVPLADWVENPETTELRVYRSRDYTQQWTMKLQWIVENNEALHALTDGKVARPHPDDRSKLWTVRDGFAIAGKTVVDPSFRPLTITGAITGLRADRLGVDDLVDERNAISRTVMEKYFNLLHSGVFTAERNRTGKAWTDKYGTRWGNSYLVGTIFDKRDVNHRMYQEFKERELRGEKGYVTVRESIYPKKHSRERGETLWPEKVPIAKALDLEQKLGQRAFRLRCMNLPAEDGTETFPARWVERAVHEELRYGQRPPEGCHLYIGYDPALGKRTKGTKFPAAVVLGYNNDLDLWYFIRYERWAIPAPEQVRRLIAWATELHCPVVVEGNNIQESYEDWIHELTTSVQVITRPTGSAKHDIDDGVESFRPLFEADRIRICAGGAPHELLAEFKEEWMSWPTGLYKDMVMSSWFGLYQHKLRWRPQVHVTQAPAPSFVAERGYRQVIDLSKYRA
jgi:hypothetical protein